MFIRLGEFIQFGFQVSHIFGHPEFATRCRSVSLDFADSFNLCQIAPDRGGTTPSRHVRDFEAHQCKLGRSYLVGTTRVARTVRDARSRLNVLSWWLRCRLATDPRRGQTNDQQQTETSFHFDSPDRTNSLHADETDRVL